jgi:DNA repair exonuclease SbcCD ATPase subunit
MGNGELTFWNSGVWLIPVILLATLGGLYLLVRYWRNRTQQDLKHNRSEMRGFQNRLRQILMTIQSYQGNGGEPYETRLVELQEQADEINARLAELERKNVASQEGMRQVAANRWQATVGGPFFWYQLRRQVRGMADDRQEIATALEQAEGLQTAIGHLPWDVAQRARQVGELQQRVDALLEQIQSRGVQGEAIQSAASQAAQSRADLSQVPEAFYKADENALLEQVDQAAVIQVHGLLEKALPLLENLLSQLHTWEHQQSEAAAKVALMRQSLQSSGQALSEMLPGLDLSGMQSQLDQLQATAGDLQRSLDGLKVEHLPSVAAEATRVHKAAQDIEARSKVARQQLAELGDLLAELNGGLKQTATQLAALGTHSVRPVIWAQSRAQLTELSGQAKRVGPASQARTPEKLVQDVEAARRLSQQQKELYQHTQEVATHHEELVTLLASPGLNQGAVFRQQVQSLLAKVQEYAVENWARGDGVNRLPEELRYFDEGLQTVARDLQEPVAESEISSRLDEARQLEQFQARLHERVEHIQARLGEIQQMEQQAQNQAAAMRAALNQAALLVSSNPFLEGLATGELGRLQKSLDLVENELENRQQGVVEKKAHNVEVLMGRAEQASQGWLDRLNKEIDGLKSTLARQVSELQGIAALDEQPVAEAQRLLSSPQSFGASGFGGTSLARPDAIILELRRRSEYWQACKAGANALQDIAGPLLEAYQSAGQERQAARQLFSELNDWLRSSRGWPPTSVDLDTERQELERLDGQWNGLRQQRARAIQLVKQYAGLEGTYRSLSERVHLAGEKAADERQKMEGLESEIDEMMQAWEQLRQNYRENQVTAGEIRRLLGDVDNERNQLKRQARQDIRSYDQILQGLQSLNRRLRLAQVSIDENHVIDVNGRIIAYR